MRNIGTALAEEPIHKRSLPVVDVSYYGDIPEMAGVHNGVVSVRGRRRCGSGGVRGEMPCEARGA